MGFGVSGQIDGYSRLISPLHTSTDNQAKTTSTFFIDSILEYGVPSCVCSDGGSEFNHFNFLMDKLIIDNRRNLIREMKDCGMMFSQKFSANTTDYFHIWKQKVF